MLIELFSLDRTAEALRAIIGSKSAISLQRGPVVPKFQVEGVAPTNHSPSQKTRQNGLSSGIKIWTDFSSVLSQCTRLTDGQTEISSLDRVCIACSAVKTNEFMERIMLKHFTTNRPSSAVSVHITIDSYSFLVGTHIHRVHTTVMLMKLVFPVVTVFRFHACTNRYNYGQYI